MTNFKNANGAIWRQNFRTSRSNKKIQKKDTKKDTKKQPKPIYRCIRSGQQRQQQQQKLANEIV